MFGYDVELQELRSENEALKATVEEASNKLAGYALRNFVLATELQQMHAHAEDNRSALLNEHADYAVAARLLRRTYSHLIHAMQHVPDELRHAIMQDLSNEPALEPVLEDA